jgi:hypothetical protein
MLLILLGSIAFVAIGIWIGTTGVMLVLPIWEVVLVVYFGVLFFAACGLYAAYRLVIRRPALEIDPAGITDASSAIGAGRLRWDDVDHVRLYSYSGQPMLGIVPRDIPLFLRRQGAVQRYLTKLSLTLGCSPINVPQVTIPMKVAELADLIRTRYGVRVEEK